MSIEIKVPAMGESVTEATVAKWLKNVGDAVKQDEPLVELETDKVNVEVPSPAAGVLDEIRVKDGTVNVGTVLGAVREGGAPATAKPSPKVESKREPAKPAASPKAEAPRPAAVATPGPPAKDAPPSMPPMPSAKRIAEEKNTDTASVAGTGKRGQVLKGDMLAALETVAAAPKPIAARTEPRVAHEREERVAMSRLRRTIAMRLKESQNTAAQLTTFNEVDMSQVMALRAHHKDDFEKKHGVKLGFMGFFVRASIAALKEIPAVNAEIDGDDIVYKNHYDIGIAVSTEKGLVVPVVRDADALTLAGIERAVFDFGTRARAAKLKIEELQGGTFTITNGGVFGSLMSTPILNPPQVGILGLHKIADRAVAINGQVVIRPMMYLALSYDHRLVDGREAVQFLVKIKEFIEDPGTLLLGS